MPRRWSDEDVTSGVDSVTMGTHGASHLRGARHSHIKSNLKVDTKGTSSGSTDTRGLGPKRGLASIASLSQGHPWKWMLLDSYSCAGGSGHDVSEQETLG